MKTISDCIEIFCILCGARCGAMPLDRLAEPFFTIHEKCYKKLNEDCMEQVIIQSAVSDVPLKGIKIF